METADLISRHVHELLPAALFAEMASFCLMPQFPTWANKPKIVVATCHGEFMEIVDRKPVRSLLLEMEAKVKEIHLHFNGQEIPNYVIWSGGNVLIIGGQSGDLKVVAKFKDVTKFELCDTDVSGTPRLSLWRFDDVIPTVLNERYEVDATDTFKQATQLEDDNQDMVSFISRKVTAAKLNTAKNKKFLDERRELRKKLTHALAEDTRYDLDAIESSQGSPTFDRITVGKIWQRIHNESWIIGIPIENISDGTLEDFEVLLKCKNEKVFNYKTSAFIDDEKMSFGWKKISLTSLVSKSRAVLVITTKEPNFTENAHTCLEGSIKYKHENKEFFLSITNIEVNAKDVIESALDPILNDSLKDLRDLLALYCISDSIALNVHFMSTQQESFVDLLKQHIGFVNRFDNLPLVLSHSKSKLHVLHGMAISVSNNKEDNSQCKMDVLFRIENQLLMLINVMYDLFPKRIVIFPIGFCAELKKYQDYKNIRTENFVEDMDFTQEMNPDTKDKVRELAATLHKQMSLVYNYLEDCVNEMSEVKIIEDNSKNNSSININVLTKGIESYKNFLNELEKQNESQNSILSELQMLT